MITPVRTCITFYTFYFYFIFLTFSLYSIAINHRNRALIMDGFNISMEMKIKMGSNLTNRELECPEKSSNTGINRQVQIQTVLCLTSPSSLSMTHAGGCRRGHCWVDSWLLHTPLVERTLLGDTVGRFAQLT